MSVFLLVLTLGVGMALGVVVTDRPIIGILTEEVYKKTYPDFTSEIAASYVKAVEQSGARVVPIFINRTEEYYRQLLDEVNGVLFPGGGLLFTNVGGFADAGRIILNYTKELNSKGDHFPILGVCLGNELLLYLEIESYDILEDCNATNVPLALTFKNGFRKSKLYQKVPRDIVKTLRKQSATYNHHQRCPTETLLKKFNLQKKWHVLTTSIDKSGNKFISSMESRDFPIVGLMFHPEKIAYEWNPSENVPHTAEAVLSARYFYDWLVGESRKNNHSFPSTEAEDAAVIYNYNANYISNGTGYYEQLYLFT